MQKILFVITKSNWGGAQRYVFDLATALPKDEWHVGVVLGGTGERGAQGGRLEEQLTKRGIRTLFLPSLMRNVSLVAEGRAVRQLWDIFSVERPEVVHLNSSKAGGLGSLAARIAGVPHIVFTSHGLPYEEDRNPIARAAIWLLTWATFLMSHRVIVLSRDHYLKARAFPFCKHKISLVYNAIAAPTYLSRAEAREALHLPQEAVVIGALGELTWNKNYHTLIRAADELAREGRKFLICIIGGGEEKQFLAELAEEHRLKDVVRFAGFLPEGHRYLTAFDVFALPSLKEGMPYVLLEAAFAGLPVVGSRVGAIPDVIGDGAGLLVEHKDKLGWRDALATLLDDEEKRKKLGEALRARVQKEYTPQHMLNGTLAAYRR